MKFLGFVHGTAINEIYTNTELLVLPSDVLDRPSPRAHPELELATEEMVTRYLALRDRGDILSQVRAALFECLPEGNVSAGRIAEQLHMTDRTLRRRLEELMERMRSGGWDPQDDPEDRSHNAAMAAKGYSRAFELVEECIRRALAGERVQFDIVQGQKGPAAENVVRLGA